MIMPAEIHVFRCLDDNIGALVHDPATGACAAIDAPEEAPILARSTRPAGRSRDILVTHRHADHVQGIAALKRALRLPRRRAGEGRAARCRPSTPTCARATRCGSASFRPMSGKRPAIAATTSPTGSRPTGALFAGDTLFTLGCGRVIGIELRRDVDAPCRGSRRCPDEARVYCGHDYVLAERALRARRRSGQRGAQGARRRGRAAKAEGRFLIPSTIGAGEGDEPVPARRRAGGGPRRQEEGADRRRCSRRCANGRTGSDGAHA